MSELHATGAHHLETADRHEVLTKLAQPLDKVAGVNQPQHLSFWQEAAAVLSFAIFPGSYSCFDRKHCDTSVRIATFRHLSRFVNDEQHVSDS
jgi:hypothetical protein